MTFSITELYGNAWETAIENAIYELNKTLKLNLFFARDNNQVDTLCERLGIRFDENGEIVK